MEFRFTKSRYLAVGRRKVDWTIVWFKPYGERSGKDGAYSAVTLYKEPIDKDVEELEDEPMFGEVLWYPFYDWQTMPASDKPEKRLQQRRFLSDVYDYYNVRGREAKARMEQILAGSGDSRRVAWLAKAKGSEKNKFTRRARLNAGADLIYDDDADGNDSTYDSDSGIEEDEREAEKPDRDRMPPPAFRGRNSDNSPNSKRKRVNKADGTTPKRPRTSASNASSRPFGQSTRETPDGGLFVSGGEGPGVSSHHSGHRSPSRITGRTGGFIYEGGDESDDGESLYSRGRPASLPRSAHSRGPLGGANGSGGDGGHESHSPSAMHGGPSRGPSMPRNPRGGANPLTTPPPTNGTVSHQGGDDGSASGDDNLGRDERGSSRANPVDIDDEEASPSSRMTIGAAAAGLQNLRRIQAENFGGREREYQDPDMDDEEAIDRAMRASMAPESMRASQAPGNMSQYRQPQRDYQDASLDEQEAVNQAMRASVAPENRSQHGGHDGLSDRLRPSIEQEAENRSQHAGEDGLPDGILPSTENDD